MKERIAKIMARAGLCSRREAEDWIRAGRVTLNGQLLSTPAVTVSSQDHIIVDGNALPVQEKIRVWLYHKPPHLITTHKDPEGRPTVFQNLPETLPRVISVGRLDVNSEGLLLLTNSGDLARFLEHPKTHIARTYRVRIFGNVEERMLKLLKKGLTIEGISYASIDASVEQKQGANQWLTLKLYEGKNREIRRIIQYFGLSLSRLIRVGYGPFSLGTLPLEGVWEVPTKTLYNDLLTLGYLKEGEKF